MELHKEDTQKNLEKYWIDASKYLPDDPAYPYVERIGGIPVQVAIEATDTFCGYRFQNTFYKDGWYQNVDDVIKFWKPVAESYNKRVWETL